MDQRPSAGKPLSPILNRPEKSASSQTSTTTSPNSNRRMNAALPSPARSLSTTISGLTLSPLLGLNASSLMGGPRVTTRRSWSPQHQSSLEVPTPRQTQSARNSLAATGCTVRQQNSIEVCALFQCFSCFLPSDETQGCPTIIVEWVLHTSTTLVFPSLELMGAGRDDHWVRMGLKQISKGGDMSKRRGALKLLRGPCNQFERFPYVAATIGFRWIVFMWCVLDVTVQFAVGSFSSAVEYVSSVTNENEWKGSGKKEWSAVFHDTKSEATRVKSFSEWNTAVVYRGAELSRTFYDLEQINRNVAIRWLSADLAGSRLWPTATSLLIKGGISTATHRLQRFSWNKNVTCFL